MIYKLVAPNDPILHEVIPEFDFLAPKLGTWDLPVVATSLWLTMRQTNSAGDIGIGIAAPQVGIRLRMFVLHLWPTKQPFAKAYVCINPSFTVPTDAPVVGFNEGCLTWPGKRKTVKRPEHIMATWTDLTGRIQKREFFGLLARAFQHELDHLEGRTIL